MNREQLTAVSVEDDGEGTTIDRGPSRQSHDLTEAEVTTDVEVLATLGNQTRYETLRLIAAADGELCVCEIEPKLDVSQGAVSQALAKLYTAGLVHRRKQGRWRYYSVTERAADLLAVFDATRARNDD